MKSEWRVSVQYCGDEKIYQVYRIRNVNEIDHSGNREYKGGCFYDRQEAVILAEELNSREV